MSRSKKKPRRKSTPSETFVLPVLGTRDVVPLPGLVIPVYITNTHSLNAINFALKTESDVCLTLQNSPLEQRPSKDNLSRMGALARVVQSVRLPSGDIKVSFHVQIRVRIQSFVSFTPFVRAKVKPIEIPFAMTLSKEAESMIVEVKRKLQVLAQYDASIEEHLTAVQDTFDPGSLADITGSLLPLETGEAQRILEELDPLARLSQVKQLLNSQIDVLAIKERISKRAQRELGQEYHQELLREQMRQIQVELGEHDDLASEITDLKRQLAQLKMPQPAKEEATKQLRRLQQLHPDTSEAALARTYLDWIVSLPWSKRTKDTIDLVKAREVLDRDHYGLEKTKERILDFLGVRKLKAGARGPILLFVGPPGVGKTSLGRSIAQALGRKFVRASVGGLRDEAELRGHRRTYVGALPGRIVQGLKTAGTKNPVFVLDEIDKIGSDFRGDPASVLLEILDPEQNKQFEDHYLNIPFDLSEVMFIGTANITDSIPSALLDRMETIEISGYTDMEKLEIGKRYLVPRELEECGLGSRKIEIGDKTLQFLINGYTRESGVRELGRILGAVLRKLARLAAEDKKLPQRILPKQIEELLGPVRYLSEQRATTDQVGIVTGLAWTQVGGEILTIEVSVIKGKGQLSLTGQLGEVMRESAMAALTYVLSRAPELGIDPNFYESSNVHIHVPHGAIPKDGPSAGVAMATALVSVLTGVPVSRHVAMTGEATLRGTVLQIGGLKEKALAAMRAGISVVIIPKENERELKEFPPYLFEKLTFAPVATLSEVFQLALVKDPLKQSTAMRTRVDVRPVKPSTRS